MKSALLPFLLAFVSISAFGQQTKTTQTPRNAPKDPAPQPAAIVVEEEKPKIKWLTIQEAAEKMKTQKKKVFVDVYTDWCGWCKRMDSSTFADKKVVKYLNENYYAIKFDAEQREDITWNGKLYKFKEVGQRGYHELAAEWLGGRLSYPTTVYIDEEMALIQAIPGFQDAAKLEMILTYFGSDNHKKTPWETWEKNFVNYRH